MHSSSSNGIQFDHRKSLTAYVRLDRFTVGLTFNVQHGHFIVNEQNMYNSQFNNNVTPPKSRIEKQLILYP